MVDEPQAPDLAAVTERQQATWASGDFHEIGRQTIPLSEELCNSLDPHPGLRVLDVACGSGNAALIAARRHCEVTGIDYVPALIERARLRAQAEKLSIDFKVGDAQSLPFPDSSFDVVVSVLGVMFAPDQEQAARELLRVCRPGGAIGLSSWMPEHFGGDFFRAHARHLPPPPGLKPATRWGTEEGLDQLLGAGTDSISSERRQVDVFFARSIEHAMQVYRSYFGPTIQAFEAAGADNAGQVWDDIAAVVERYNRATDESVIVEAQYLQTIAVRAA